MAVFDASALVYFFAPEARGPIDPLTQKPVTYPKQRIDHQIQILGKRKERILIPTPALSEILVYAGNASDQYLEILRSVKSFQVTDFDILAAIELAHLTRVESTRQLHIGTNLTRAKLKFDRKIIAIALVHRQTIIYSDDQHLARFAAHFDIQVNPTYDLPLPIESDSLFPKA